MPNISPMELISKRLSNNHRITLLDLDYYTSKIFEFFAKKKFLNPKNILVVELLQGIGDLIAATPSFKAIKSKFPNSNITIMVHKKNRDLLKNNPYLNRIVYNAFKSSLKQIKNKYDLAVLLHPGSFKISLMLVLAKIPYRIGCSHPSSLLSGKGFFLHKKPKPVKMQHTVFDYLDVVKLLNIKVTNPELELYLTKEELLETKKYLKKRGITRKFIIVIHPSAAFKTHNWFSDRFAEVADTLIERYKAEIIFTGSKEDSLEIDKIIYLMKNKNKAHNTSGSSLRLFLSLIKRSNLVISVDTSAIHVAAAFNTPVIALFGASDPEKWRPFSKKQIVIFKNNVCTNCMRRKCSRDHDCMDAIKKEDILKAVELIRNES